MARHQGRRFLTEPQDHHLEVLQLVAAGLSDVEIAKHLFITPSTVSGRIRKARELLGAQTRCEAVAIALRTGKIQ
jgi:DNA-binding CsgD family transcriptional regulator